MMPLRSTTAAALLRVACALALACASGCGDDSKPPTPPVNMWPVPPVANFDDPSALPDLGPMPPLPGAERTPAPTTADATKLGAQLMTHVEAARKWLDSALFVEHDHLLFPPRALPAMQHALTALAMLADLERLAWAHTGKPLADESLQFVGREMRRLLDTLRHVPGCPDVAMAGPRLATMLAARAASVDLLRAARQRAILRSTDPAVALQTFDRLTADAEVLMQGLTMDLDTGVRVPGAASIAAEVFATAHDAFLLWRHAQSLSADTISPAISQLADEFRSSLLALAKRPGMPTFSLDALDADYEAALAAARQD
ncbi:MAG: hypothetical protein AB7S36_10870 [Planctomycetota bacterium]